MRKLLCLVLVIILLVSFNLSVFAAEPTPFKKITSARKIYNVAKTQADIQNKRLKDKGYTYDNTKDHRSFFHRSCTWGYLIGFCCAIMIFAPR